MPPAPAAAPAPDPSAPGAASDALFATTWSTLRDAAPSTFTCPLDGPTGVVFPPAGSVWLGARESDGMQLWGQRDGTLVRSMPGKPLNSATAPAPAPARNVQEPAPTAGLGLSSMAALIVAIGSLLFAQPGSSAGSSSDIAKLSPPHEPGTNTPRRWLELALPCVVTCWLLTAVVLSQAKSSARRGWWALLAHRGTCKHKPTPRFQHSSSSIENGFAHATSLGRRALVDSILHLSPPWLTMFYLLQWGVLLYLRFSSDIIGYHTAANSPPTARCVVPFSSVATTLSARATSLIQSLHFSPNHAFLPLFLLVRWAQGDLLRSIGLAATLASGCYFAHVPLHYFCHSLAAACAQFVGSRLSRPLSECAAPTVAPCVADDGARDTSDAPAPPRIGRAALSSIPPTAKHLSRHRGWKSRFHVSRWLTLIVDSGCTWHIHNRRDDLVNLRPCNDVVIDAHGRQARCSTMGDLPLALRDSKGRELCLLLRGVRLAESFTETLLSVDQLWATSGIDTVFRNDRHFVFTRNAGLLAPFRRVNGSFVWEVGVLLRELPESMGAAHVARHPRDGSRPYDYKGEIHAPSAQSHIHALSANGVAAILHRRLHVGIEHIRRLSRFSIDAPAHVASASRLSCEGCSEANATHLPHTASRYQPSHVGRLIHADIVGPFVSSRIGSYKYGLVLVDDHSRYKSVKFLRARSDAPAAVRSFVAELNAGLSTRAVAPVRVVGTLHTDNAGEFLSREFTELLDSELISHTTCPPHIHQLNGVAERAIRSVLQLARAYLTSSGVDVHHWPAAFDMAVDVLNRTSGPPSSAPGGGPSSFEVLTGVPPRVMHIMPFGCRAFAVKPRSQYSKTTLDPRAWVGVNLGRCSSIPGAYRVYVPSTGRVVHTSDVYFLESYFPCRPRGSQLDDSAPPIPVPAPAVGARAALARARAALSSAYGDAVSRVCPSRRVLLLFSGPKSRPDGIAAFLHARGVDVDQVDSRTDDGGGADHDILNDSFFSQLLKQTRSGKYGVVFAAPPCSTYSVSRYFKPKTPHDGPPPVRSRKHILGLPAVPPAHRAELQRANEITRRTAILLMAAHRSGAEFIVENPVDRGDPAHLPFFQFAEHGPIWLDPYMQELGRSCATESATFAQCMFGAASQKYTTLWFTAGLAPALRPLRQLVCSHAPGSHSSQAGGVKEDRDAAWNSATSASYPPDFNLYITETLVNFFTAAKTVEPDVPRTLPSPPTSDVPAASDFLPPPVVAALREPPRSVPEPHVAASPPRPHESVVSAAEEVHSTLESEGDPDAVAATTKPLKPLIFRRGLGPIHLRPRSQAGTAHSARSSCNSSDPTSHSEAMRLDASGWSASEASEIANHERAQSWSYIERDALPAGRRIVRLTWAYKTKRDGRQKARLCVQGCSQVAGVDYNQTFCAALRAGSLRILCAIAAKLGLYMRRWDFVAAYLQGTLEDGEFIYCSPAPGYSTKLVDGQVRMVPLRDGDGVPRLCKVEKPVYGMAQAGRRWQRSIFPWLLNWGDEHGCKLKQSRFDTCVFSCSCDVTTRSGVRREQLYIGCYVDDLFVLSSHRDEDSLYHKFTTDLQSRWDVEDEGDVADLLNVEITREGSCVKLCQTSYVNKLMSTYAPNGVPTSSFGAGYPLKSHPAGRVPASPSLPQLVLDATAQAASDIDVQLLKDYQSLVGALLYCAVPSQKRGAAIRVLGSPAFGDERFRLGRPQLDVRVRLQLL
mmetsp:Transcript_32844/g.79785  ORF Transcript_32844/g.79785 Transcript_32844/m.79785 type:complete len:1719 (+) Transcript_32844:1464-6620(+)